MGRASKPASASRWGCESSNSLRRWPSGCRRDRDDRRAVRGHRHLPRPAGRPVAATPLLAIPEAEAVSTYKTSLQPGESIDVTGSGLTVVQSPTLVTVASAVAPPPPPPPPSGSWFAYPGTIPAGAKTYTGS